MAVTRIKNNQITDATITAQKIANQTLVGSLFATDLTLISNVSIVGNLTITGNSSNINAINTFITDPFVIFNNGYNGSLANYTIGFLVNRNLATLNSYGAVNTAWIWSEADSAFVGLATTDTGVGITSINNSGYANIKIGNASVVTNLTAGTINASTVNYTDAVATTLVATNFSSGNARISGGYADNFPIGANTATTGAFTTLSTTSTFTSSGNIVAGSGTASSNTTTGALVVVGGAGVSGSLNIGANVTAGNVISSSYYSTGGTTRFQLSDIGLVTIDVAGVQYKFGAAGIESSPGIFGGSFGGSKLSLNSETNLIANRLDVVKIQTGTDGSIQNEWTFSNNALTTPGGVTVNGTINAHTANVITFVASNFSTANSLITGGSINNTVIGNTTAAAGTFTTITATTIDAGTTTTATLNSTSGNITTLGAGTTTTATLNTTSGNITTGNSTTFVATNLSSANAQVTGGSANNFKVGNTSPDTGAFTTLSSNGQTTFTNATQSDSASTGAVVVTGGVGIGANLNVAGNVTVAGNLTVLGNSTVFNTETLTVEDLNITVAANATSGAEANGAGMTVAGANATFTYLNADDSWNLNKKLNATTVGAATADITTGNITTATVVNGKTTTLVATNLSSANAQVTGGSINATIIGNTTAAAATFTTANAGTLNVTTGNITTLDTGTTTTAILNATTGNITTLDAGTTTTAILNTTTANVTDAKASTLVATNFSSGNARITGGYADNFPIGANTAAPGAFTTLSTTGNLVARSGTASVSYVTGAIVVPDGGGVGITGALNVQGTSNFLGNINAGNILLSGNINVPVGGVTTTLGVFFGNAGGIGALYAGAPGYTPLDHTVLQMTANIDNYAQVNFQNINSGLLASTDFVATADNGSDSDGYINLGINSSTFNDAEYPGFFPNDGYLVHHGVGTGGNLIVMSELAGTAIKFRIGGYGDDAAKVTVTENGFYVNSTTVSTSVTSGALQAAGGAGVAGNINVGLGAAFNTTKTANYDFVVRGVNDDTLIWARPGTTYDSVVIGNSATVSTLVTGAKLFVNTTDSIRIPTGTTAQRPSSVGGSDVAGMIRVNTSVSQMEYYDGSAWRTTGAANVTIIASDGFSGDDVTTDFTLTTSTTTNGCIVSINGIVQNPSTAYSVGGVDNKTLAFTQAPASGDAIDVRILTTTGTISSLVSQNGYMGVVANNSALILTSGAASAVERINIGTNGNIAISGNIAPTANVTYDIGSNDQWFKTFYGVSTKAQYADLAENYQADSLYSAGTVLEFGGEYEVTACMTEGSARIAGVVSTNPAHLMNGGLRGSNVVPLALMGRVPCMVIGPIRKGDMMISAGYGYAKASAQPAIGTVIGKALTNFDGDKGIVEIVVGRV